MQILIISTLAKTANLALEEIVSAKSFIFQAHVQSVKQNSVCVPANKKDQMPKRSPIENLL